MNMSRPRRSAIETRPVLLGPVTFLKLGKSKDPALDPLSLLADLLPVYVDVLRRLEAEGAEWVQIDEPCLVLDLDDATRAGVARRPTRMFAARIARAEAHADHLFRRRSATISPTALALPVAGLHRRSRARAASSSTPFWRGRRAALCCRSAWSTAATSGGPNLPRSSIASRRSSPSAGADHIGSRRPVRCCTCRSTLIARRSSIPDLKNWLAFAVQKMGELAALGAGARPAAETLSPRRSPTSADAAIAARAASAQSASTRRSRPASLRSRAGDGAAGERLSRRAANGSGRARLPLSRQRRSVRSRRPPKFARRAPRTAGAHHRCRL